MDGPQITASTRKTSDPLSLVLDVMATSDRTLDNDCLCDGESTERASQEKLSLNPSSILRDADGARDN